MPGNSLKIALLGKPECHLCEDAEIVVQKVCGRNKMVKGKRTPIFQTGEMGLPNLHTPNHITGGSYS